MGLYQHPHGFDPLDLEIIDRVYEAAWARLEAQEPFRDRVRDTARQETLRKLVFVYAHDAKGGAGNHVDFDALCEQVLECLESSCRAMPLAKKSRGTLPQVGA
jgi:hypothetical protein